MTGTFDHLERIDVVHESDQAILVDGDRVRCYLLACSTLRLERERVEDPFVPGGRLLTGELSDGRVVFRYETATLYLRHGVRPPVALLEHIRHHDYRVSAELSSMLANR